MSVFTTNGTSSRKKLMYSNRLELLKAERHCSACYLFSLHAIYCHLPAVLRVVNEINDEPNSETTVDANGLKAEFDL